MIPHYVYNDTKYFNRKDALDAMLLNNDYESTLEFRYGEEIFQKLNWKQNPVDINVGTLYKLRAQQIRNKYDYVILLFSGGSDSTQVLTSFLKNNIFIDEIQTVNHEKLISKVDNKTLINDKEFSQLLEYKLAVKPMLERVRAISPNTKITALDASDYSYENHTKKYEVILGSNDLPLPTTHRISAGIPHTYHFYINEYNMRNRINTKTCIVRGFEKPILFFIDDNLAFSFSDIMMYSRNETYLQQFAIEDFYWSVDAPLIPLKQAHMIKTKLETDKKFYERFYQSKQIIDRYDGSGYTSAHMIERELSNIIYPDWNSSTFAAPKTTNMPSEMKLVKFLDSSSFSSDIINDIKSTNMLRYSKIKNKTQFSKTIYGSYYYLLGPLNFKWEKYA